MTQPKEVLQARIICAAKEINRCEKTCVSLRDIYDSALQQYFSEYGDPGKPFHADDPKYSGVIEHTRPYYQAWQKEKRKIYNARQKMKRATTALMLQEKGV